LERDSPPVTGVPGRIGTLGPLLKFTFACKGAAGQVCLGQVRATAIEKLSANGKKITGLLSDKPRTGRYRVLDVLKGSLSAPASQSNVVSIRLNSAGQMLRNKFNNVPVDVNVTATVASKTVTIRTAKVIFGLDPAKIRITDNPSTNRGTVTFTLRCKGLARQTCRGTAQIATYALLSADGRTITGLASEPSGNSKPVTIASVGYSLKGANKLQMSIEITRAGKDLLAEFSRIPATLKLTPTYNSFSSPRLPESSPSNANQQQPARQQTQLAAVSPHDAEARPPRLHSRAGDGARA
jgi:hypothetical protein